MDLVKFHHICIQTPDYEASLDFYSNTLGFKVKKINSPFHTREYNTWLEGGGIMIELQTPKSGNDFLPWSKENSGPVHICLVVDDVDSAYNAIKASGNYSFKNKNGKEIYEVCGSKLFKVHAPEGTEIEIRDNPSID